MGILVSTSLGLTLLLSCQLQLVPAENVTERDSRHRAEFPCPTQYRETANLYQRTVHSLRPQDVDLVASVGDSITAGTGALANNILQVNDENRGSTYFTGSDGDWDTCPSVFNFIKNYNPAVRGGATGRTRIVMLPLKKEEVGDKGLNLSVSGAVAEDLPGMVRRLVKMVTNFTLIII